MPTTADIERHTKLHASFLSLSRENSVLETVLRRYLVEFNLTEEYSVTGTPVKGGGFPDGINTFLILAEEVAEKVRRKFNHFLFLEGWLAETEDSSCNGDPCSALESLTNQEDLTLNKLEESLQKACKQGKPTDAIYISSLILVERFPNVQFSTAQISALTKEHDLDLGTTAAGTIAPIVKRGDFDPKSGSFVLTSKGRSTAVAKAIGYLGG